MWKYLRLIYINKLQNAPKKLKHDKQKQTSICIYIYIQAASAQTPASSKLSATQAKNTSTQQMPASRSLFLFDRSLGLSIAHLLDLYCAFICIFGHKPQMQALNVKHSADAIIQVSFPSVLGLFCPLTRSILTNLLTTTCAWD
jgi:hypothetical protein